MSYLDYPPYVSPRFAHNCPDCVFVGRWHDSNAGASKPDTYDLYVCRKGMGGFTVLARFGSFPDKYTSGASLALQHPALCAALVAGVDQGVIGLVEQKESARA